MYSLTIEIEDQHTGEITKSIEKVICNDIEDWKLKRMNQLKYIHCTTNYKLSRIYINK